MTNITHLGEARLVSPHRRSVNDALRLPDHIVHDPENPPQSGLLFELCGPRAKLFFDPKETCAGIVTCGGLCPGLNNVIRSLYLELHHAYGVKEVLGFRGGYQGLDPARGAEPVVLTSAFASGSRTISNQRISREPRWQTWMRWRMENPSSMA